MTRKISPLAYYKGREDTQPNKKETANLRCKRPKKGQEAYIYVCRHTTYRHRAKTGGHSHIQKYIYRYLCISMRVRV